MGAVLRGVGGQLVKNHGHRLSGFGNHTEGWALYDRIVVTCARRELRANKLGQVHTLPAALTQENVRVGQRPNAAVEGVKEVIPRRAAFASVLCNRRDACQHVLHAMIELRIQKGLLILGALGRRQSQLKSIVAFLEPVLAFLEGCLGASPLLKESSKNE